MTAMEDRVITVDISRRNDPQEIVIGREAGVMGVDYAIDDEYVSTRHAKIAINSMGVVFIQDLGSTNGTMVNGMKVWDKMIVNPPGAVLRVGHTDLQLRLVDDWLSRVTSDSIRPHCD